LTTVSCVLPVNAFYKKLSNPGFTLLGHTVPRLLRRLVPPIVPPNCATEGGAWGQWVLLRAGGLDVSGENVHLPDIKMMF